MVIRDRDIRTDSTSYVTEHVDRLPFNTPEKSDRYRTERYQGAVGLNWYTCDPTIQFLMRYHLTSRRADVARAAPQRTSASSWAVRSRSARTRPTRTRRDSSATTGGDTRSATSTSRRARRQTKRDIFERGLGRAEMRQEAQRAGVRLGPATSGAELHAQPGRGRDDVRARRGRRHGRLPRVSLRTAGRRATLVMTKLASGEWAGKTAQLLTERTGGSDLGPDRDDGDAARRCVAPERVQVVRVELRR